MKQGYLSEYFEAVAAKRLTPVEVNKKVSNQHEFNGSAALKQVLGTNDHGEKVYFTTRFIWMGEENETVITDGKLSWYDSRYDDDKRSPEWRLYFPTTDVTELAQPGDLLLIAKRSDGTVLSIIVSGGTTVESQMLWLFNVPVQSGKSFVYQSFVDGDDKEVDFAVRLILDELGIDIEEPEADYLDSILDKYKGDFPTTKEFSTLTRSQLKHVNAIDDPDSALMTWMNYEEKLFRRMERYEIEQVLRTGFVNESGTDVDGFLKFSLSVQQRRRSRAGLALENHLEEIFKLHKIKCVRLAETENKAKPDFLFPGSNEYHNQEFPAELLTMLGVKTTCKDRWRQVLSEAARIKNKHLFTLEPGISRNQTTEMIANSLQLVLPSALHETYHEEQKEWLVNLNDFIRMVEKKQMSII